MNDRLRHEIDEAVRALAAARALAGQPRAGGPDPVMDALVALEAARTAREHVFLAVAMLADEALHRGASVEELGIMLDP